MELLSGALVICLCVGLLVWVWSVCMCNVHTRRLTNNNSDMIIVTHAEQRILSRLLVAGERHV